MKKIKVEQKNSNDEMMIDIPSGVFDYLGILFIGFAVVDYAASRMGTNLTAFLGPLSQFTPISAGLIGGILWMIIAIPVYAIFRIILLELLTNIEKS